MPGLWKEAVEKKLHYLFKKKQNKKLLWSKWCMTPNCLIIIFALSCLVLCRTLYVLIPGDWDRQRTCVIGLVSWTVLPCVLRIAFDFAFSIISGVCVCVPISLFKLNVRWEPDRVLAATTSMLPGWINAGTPSQAHHPGWHSPYLGTNPWCCSLQLHH